jgi:lipooligosaccharide transport system ATP-binding protein
MTHIDGTMTADPATPAIIPPAAPVLEARGLVKRFGAFTAVDGTSFSVGRGECFGFLGPNGAGKTTTMRMITGHLPLTEGALSVLGLDATAHMRAIKGRIGVVPQEDNLDPDLTVMDNLLVFAAYHGMARRDARERADELLGFMQLSEHGKNRIEKLSGGMKRRLLIARALINRPELLILDEPTTGLDPQARHMIWQKLRSLLAQGVTQLLTTHYMDEAEQLCHRLVIMDKAKILVEGSPADLIARYAGREVIEARLRNGEEKDGCLADIGRAGLEGVTVESSGDTLFIYAADAAALLPRLNICPDRTILHRRASLEDVFLRLTGRELVE